MNQEPGRIVVGIDGSDAAINAAEWAVTEAVGLNVPIRLVFAVPERQGESGGDPLDVEYAETSLRASDAAIAALGEPVKVECAIVPGAPEDVLVGESGGAALVCIGSVGIGRVARRVLGSTADAVARRARCPVAIVRTDREAPEGGGTDPGWVAVVVDDSRGNDAVLAHGFREAELRGAPILAMGVWRWGVGEIPFRQLDERLGPWVERYPGIHVMPAAARHGAAEFLSHTQECIQLAVVGTADADKVARMVGPTGQRFGGRCGCSVLVVRG
ncbi:universal stress protein [Mycobacterium sp. Marseille-P9652]|uniref:universal stress protein n=1 Tax=Mycobacterium sp. Marseille-P9652 TaxID=2654950 RepID=UPI0012E8D79E|nr:universal stress protein [Mycobacterium sp. Marseille-P9652]